MYITQDWLWYHTDREKGRTLKKNQNLLIMYVMKHGDRKERITEGQFYSSNRLNENSLR